MKNSLTILSGNANRSLSGSICKELGVPLGKSVIGRFPEGEIKVQLKENIRGRDIFIIQSMCTPVNDHLMELFCLIDAAKRASAERITAVLPYYAYARQDRKDRPRVPITAKLIANLLVTAGANRILTMDLHAGQIQGFFDIPVDHLYSIKVLIGYLRSKKIKNLVVVTPDVGGIKMARAYSNMLKAPLAIIDKRREDEHSVKVMNLIGEVKDKNVILVDDLVSTGGSLVEAASALKKFGAHDIYAAVVHPVLAGPAAVRLKSSVIKEFITSDTIPISNEKRSKKITVLSVAPLLAEAIKRIHENTSVSSLFARASVEA
ncbi:MAG: ribose-phosphate pyrophosphokinase [Candidatus Omnitrophica bacterium]|nr:ribose-phosphate pyrophosphokinase [Candidatus Omnitrophota bacterium]